MKGILRALPASSLKRTDRELADVGGADVTVDVLVDAVAEAALEDVGRQHLHAQLCKQLHESAAANAATRARIQVKLMPRCDGGSGAAQAGKAASVAAPECASEPKGVGWHFDVSGRNEWQGPFDSKEEAVTANAQQCSFRRLLLNRV